MIIRKIEIETIMESQREFNSDEWLVYGHSDIFKTKLLKDDFDIKTMYKESLNYDNHFKQVFYLFNDETDITFWDEAKNFDFSAVYFIFLDYAENDYEKKSLKKHVIDNNIGYDKIQIYETLDNYDGIIIIHGNSPNEIQKKINIFLNECSKKNIFVKDLYKMFMSSYEKINGQVTYDENLSLQIQMVLKESQNSNNVLNEIEQETGGVITNISGSNHLNINVNCISKSKLFSLYKSINPEGILSINSIYRKNIIKTTRLKFMMEIDKSIKYIRRTSLDPLSKKFKKQLDNLKIENNETNDFYKAQLDRIENSMQHILTNNLPDYSFLALYPSLIKFLEKVRSSYPFEEKDNCVRYFLEAAKEIINMSDGIQIGYYLLQSYICKEVFAPSELISFYSAFLWEFNKKILSMQNDKDSQFVFCLEPSLKANVQIKGLFLDDKKVQDRLLLVYIPMKYFYNPKIMLFSLCHEGSHYVGEEIRCRNERAKYINLTYIYWLIDQLCFNIDMNLINKYSIRDIIIDRYKSYVKFFSKKYKFSKYSQDLKNILSLSTKSLLVDLSFEVTNIFKYPYDKNDEDFVKKIKDINTILKKIKNNSKTMLINVEYDEIIDNIIYVYSEAFSDKLAKMVLDINENQYIDIIKESYGIDDLSEINEDFIILRIMANCYSKNNTLDEEIQFMDGRIGNYATIYSQFLKLENGNSYLALPSIFKNPAMLKCLIDYLNYCGNRFNDYLKNNELIFSKLRESMTEEFNLKIIKEFNKEYREDIHKVINNELNINKDNIKKNNNLKKRKAIMKILITGSSGFVGKNLVETLKTIKDGKCRIYDIDIEDIYTYDKNNSLDELKAYTKDCDAVVHLAGVNRPKDVKEFYEGNSGFSETLCKCLIENDNQCPIIVSSSIQAYRNNDYGKSKKMVEDYLLDFGKRYGNKVYIYRFANLFGKWCQPNYNSVVATWCYNISHDLDIQINNPDAVVPLCYIDDVVDEIIHALMSHPSVKVEGYYAVEPIYEVTLKRLSEILYMFKEQPKTLAIPEIGNHSLEKKLYSTYLSYLPNDKISFPLKMNKDDRGSFTELLKSEKCGQISVNISKPGITKGQHWHHSKWEFFIVVSGHGLIQERKIGTDEVIEFEVSGDKIEAIHMLPGYTHNIINLSDKEDLITVMWANENFDPHHPDTYYEEV